MENAKKPSKVSYIKTDDNTIINEACIRWVMKMNECLDICAKSTACARGVDTHRVCKTNSPDSYAKLHAHFE